MTEQKMKELISEYEKLKSLLEVDRNLQKQGVWGFIPSENLPNICKFVETFEQGMSNLLDKIYGSKIPGFIEGYKALKNAINPW